METYTFWRTREARFRELAQVHRGSDLHATRTDVNVPSLLAQASERTRAAINNPAATLESVFGHARTTARAGRILLDGEQADQWIVSGGPADERLRASLQSAFKAEAAMAAVGADEADGAATDQAALEAWLELIARAGAPQGRNVGILQQLAAVSADMCNSFASRAYRDDRARSAAIASPAKATQLDAFPRRAAWLKDQMATQDLTRHRIGVLGDIDDETVDRIARGERVRPQSLDKLARALGASRSAIPND